MMSAKAKHPNCAYMWMDYVSAPKVQAQQATYYGETPGQQEGLPVHGQDRPRLCATYKANAPDVYYRSIKFWKTPLADCGDSRGKVCTSYTKWVQAWTQVKS